MPVAYGVLQGMERFVALGMLMLAVAASRIVIGVPWTEAGGGAGGPLLGQALGSLLALLATAWLVRGYMLRQRNRSRELGPAPPPRSAHARCRRSVHRRSR